MSTAAPELNYIGYDEFLATVRILAQRIAADAWRPDFIIGIGRGGLTPAVYMSQILQLPMLSIDHSAKVPGFADELLAKVAAMSAAGQRFVFVDDINDSGGTIAYIRGLLAEHGGVAEHLRFAVLIDNVRSMARVDYAVTSIDRHEQKCWFVFPWEAVATQDVLVDEALSVPERLG